MRVPHVRGACVTARDCSPFPIAGDKAGAAALSAHAPALSKAAQRGGGGAGPGDAPATALLDSDAASPDAEMMRWAEAQGIRARIRPASFAGLRGAAASAAIRADEPAVEVPASALITLRTAMESELGPLLKILPGARLSSSHAPLVRSLQNCCLWA